MHSGCYRGNDSPPCDLAVFAPHQATTYLARRQRACARAEEQREESEHLVNAIVDGCRGEKDDRRIPRQACESLISLRCGVSGMMRLIHDEEIMCCMRVGDWAGSTEPLNADKIRDRLRRPECLSPHGGERSRRHNQTVGIPAGNRSRDESLAQSDVIAKKNAAKLLERRLGSRHRHLLMWFQRDITEARTRLVVSENNLGNSGANSRCRL